MKRIHLISNAHIDPYWQWEWEEGAAEAISTFRSAADLCEEYDGFIFNHNEALLYQWVEEFEPALFERIQRLVREGKWYIMGGWHLQPDCNMPSGESFVRQALSGKTYFMEKFGVEPRTAINFDPFGHTRGLVQILKKAGFDSYAFCRPEMADAGLPGADFTWVGYDGSEVSGHFILGHYGSALGEVDKKLKAWIDNFSKDREIGCMLWGVGNHGGGPSRKDLDILATIMRETKDVEIVHSTFESFFKDLEAQGVDRGRHEADINPWAVGCYTSQVLLKQKHRLLENELFMTEKMCSHAALAGLMAYPQEEFKQAQYDLLTGEFHDILPGSSIQPVEDAALRLFNHGLEILSRIKTRAFFCLTSGQPKAPEGMVPIVAHNPHPYPVDGVFQCEFMLPKVQWGDVFTLPQVYHNGELVPCQVEKEHSSINADWRKRVVFRARLAPSSVSRFDCTLDTMVDKRPVPHIEPENGRIVVRSDKMVAAVNCATGLLDQYTVDGVNYLASGAFLPRVINDNEDPWGMTVHHFRDEAGAFKLMSPEEGTRFSGLKLDNPIPSVRVVEDGPVRVVIEALLSWGDSFIVLTYKLPRQGAEIETHVRVHWNEKDKALKLALPVAFGEPEYRGQVAYGSDVLPGAKLEVVAQKWTAAVSPDGAHALTIINDGVYGSDVVGNEVRMTLLRSAAYCGHPIGDRDVLPQNRYTPRIDQGERQYTFWINAGSASERLALVDREALSCNEKPFLVSFCPSGQGVVPPQGVVLDDMHLLVTAFKKAEKGDQYVVRLFEPTGTPRTARLKIPVLGIEREVRLGAFEIQTWLVDPAKKTMVEADLLERPLVG